MCGQDEDRHFTPSLTPALEHIRACQIGKTEVQDRRVEVFGATKLVTCLAVRSTLYGESYPLESFGESSGKIGVILDY